MTPREFRDKWARVYDNCPILASSLDYKFYWRKMPDEPLVKAVHDNPDYRRNGLTPLEFVQRKVQYRSKMYIDLVATVATIRMGGDT